MMESNTANMNQQPRFGNPSQIPNTGAPVTYPGPPYPQTQYPQVQAIPVGFQYPPSQVGPQQIIIYQQPVIKKEKVYESYKSRVSLILGWTQIILSFLSIICGSIGLWLQALRVTKRNPNPALIVSAGIWTAVPYFLLSGGYAIGAAKLRTKCRIVANLVLSIISCVLAIALLADSSLALQWENTNTVIDLPDVNSTSTITDDPQKSGSVAVAALLLIISIGMIICLIYSSLISCAAICCGRKTLSDQQEAANTTSGNTVVVMTNPKDIPIAQQPHFQQQQQQIQQTPHIQQQQQQQLQQQQTLHTNQQQLTQPKTRLSGGTYEPLSHNYQPLTNEGRRLPAEPGRDTVDVTEDGGGSDYEDPESPVYQDIRDSHIESSEARLSEISMEYLTTNVK